MIPLAGKDPIVLAKRGEIIICKDRVDGRHDQVDLTERPGGHADIIGIARQDPMRNEKAKFTGMLDGAIWTIDPQPRRRARFGRASNTLLMLLFRQK